MMVTVAKETVPLWKLVGCDTEALTRQEMLVGSVQMVTLKMTQPTLKTESLNVVMAMKLVLKSVMMIILQTMMVVKGTVQQ